MSVQLVAMDKLIFSISCLLVLICVPLRFTGHLVEEQVLVAFAAPCAWMIVPFFARYSTCTTADGYRISLFNQSVKLLQWPN